MTQNSPFVESSGDSLKILALPRQIIRGVLSLFCGIFKKTVNRDDIFIEAVPPNGGTQPEVVTGKDASNITWNITSIASVSEISETQPKKDRQNQRTVLRQNKATSPPRGGEVKRVPFYGTSARRRAEVKGDPFLPKPCLAIAKRNRFLLRNSGLLLQNSLHLHLRHYRELPYSRMADTIGNYVSTLATMLIQLLYHRQLRKWYKVGYSTLRVGVTKLVIPSFVWELPTLFQTARLSKPNKSVLTTTTIVLTTTQGRLSLIRVWLSPNTFIPNGKIAKIAKVGTYFSGDASTPRGVDGLSDYWPSCTGHVENVARLYLANMEG